MTPIVFVPGLLCTAEIFAPQLAALWPYGPVAVASTLEGDSIAAMAAAVLAAAPPRFALAGISMGGYVGFEILRQAPERVAGLALLSTSARPDRPEQSAQRRALVERARGGDFRGVVAGLPDLLLHPDHRRDPALRETLVRMGLAVGVEAFARQQEAIIGRPDSRPGLAAVGVPTLVLVGQDDPLTPPDCAAEMAQAVPHARLVQVPHCGHASTLEQPAAVNLALAEWAGAVDAGAR
jgi:pimeloyl-ACP methyl ester carboxylesterase